MTRLSCHRFRSNEFRLWLGVIAYNLGNLWRRLALPKGIKSWSLSSLQQRLVNARGRMIKHACCYWLLLAETYDYGELDEVSLAYAVTIHKAQGSEFPAVVIPVAMQHYMLLQRNLIYTGITRAKRLLVMVGQKKAMGLAVRNDQARKRYSGLLHSLKELSLG